MRDCNIYNVSLCKSGILGGLMYVMEAELVYGTNKLTVPEKIRRLHMPYQAIQSVEAAPLHTVTIAMKNGECYRFLVFSRKKFLEDVIAKWNTSPKKQEETPCRTT